jgi:hypothetical protein
LLLLQARVASLTARQEAYDKQDFQALHRTYGSPDDDPKIRLLELRKRLGVEGHLLSQHIDPPIPVHDASELGRRVKDIALSLDYPLSHWCRSKGKAARHGSSRGLRTHRIYTLSRDANVHSWENFWEEI